MRNGISPCSLSMHFLTMSEVKHFSVWVTNHLYFFSMNCVLILLDDFSIGLLKFLFSLSAVLPIMLINIKLPFLNIDK